MGDENNDISVYDIFGYIATCSLTLMMLPQVIHTYKTKDAKSISWMFLVLESITGICFTVYGLGVLKDTDTLTALPILISNPISFALTFLVSLMKYKYDV